MKTLTTLYELKKAMQSDDACIECDIKSAKLTHCKKCFAPMCNTCYKAMRGLCSDCAFITDEKNGRFNE